MAIPDFYPEVRRKRLIENLRAEQVALSDLGMTADEIATFQASTTAVERRFDAVMARRAGRVPPHHNPPANTPGDHPIPAHTNEDNHVRRGGTD